MQICVDVNGNSGCTANRRRHTGACLNNQLTNNGVFSGRCTLFVFLFVCLFRFLYCRVFGSDGSSSGCFVFFQAKAIPSCVTPMCKCPSEQVVSWCCACDGASVSWPRGRLVNTLRLPTSLTSPRQDFDRKKRSHDCRR